MGKIVIPKNSASLEEVMGAMRIYNDADDWISNSDFILTYKNRIGVIGDDRDSSAYTKKTEIGAYYGFLKWEDINSTQSPRRITPRGKLFLKHYDDNDTDAYHEDIMKSLEEVTFGRNNYACRSCDSDIEPPALFLRAVLDLGYLNNVEFAYLVYSMEYKGQHYTDTIQEIKEKRSANIHIELPDEARKYSDPKPILILERWGVLTSEQIGGYKATKIAPSFLAKYKTRLENLKIYNIDKSTGKKEGNNSSMTIYTPEWFKEKAKEFPTLDQEAEEYLKDFDDKFSVDILSNLSGMDMLRRIFLNDKTKDNLCYALEYDKTCRSIFGSIKNGTAYKYGLHYSKKHDAWVTGTNQNPQVLTEDEAIEVGTQIRDSLIEGAEVVLAANELNSVEDYLELYNKLFTATDGNINRIWFLKYYQMLLPEAFPPFYSEPTQRLVLDCLGIAPLNNSLERMGQIKTFVDECEISSVVFHRIFWTYCANNTAPDDIEGEEIIDEVDSDDNEMKFREWMSKQTSATGRL